MQPSGSCRLSSQFNIVDLFNHLFFHISHPQLLYPVCALFVCCSSLCCSTIVYCCVLFDRLTVWCSTYSVLLFFLLTLPVDCRPVVFELSVAYFAYCCCEFFVCTLCILSLLCPVDLFSTNPLCVHSCLHCWLCFPSIVINPDYYRQRLVLFQQCILLGLKSSKFTSQFLWVYSSLQVFALENSANPCDCKPTKSSIYSISRQETVL